MDTALVIVERVEDQPRVTSFSYVDPEAPNEQSQFRAKENREEFALTPAQAAAAIATGGFRVKESSKSEAQTTQIDTKENSHADTESV